MALTRRHQAIHDSVTGTTVRIRDLAIADEAEIRWERDIAEPAGLPSRGRRITVIAGYIAASFIALSVVDAAILSHACIASNRCSTGETIFNTLLNLAWIGLSVWVIIAAWRGRLWGCRSQPLPPDGTGPSA
jgi:hypothetical protein